MLYKIYCKRTYTPDFYLPDLNKYLEVKGYFSNIDKDKLNLVITQNKVDLLLIRGSDINNNLVDFIQAVISPLSYTQSKG